MKRKAANQDVLSSSEKVKTNNNQNSKDSVDTNIEGIDSFLSKIEQSDYEKTAEANEYNDDELNQDDEILEKAELQLTNLAYKAKLQGILDKGNKKATSDTLNEVEAALNINISEDNDDEGNTNNNIGSDDVNPDEMFALLMKKKKK